MKNYLFMLLICLGISNVHAQKTDDLRFGYVSFMDYYAYTNRFYYDLGFGNNSAASAAIRIPSSIAEQYAGKKITKIRFGSSDDCTNVSVWIRNALTGANLVTQNVGNTKKGWTEVSLSTPFTIPASDCYIGYTATGTNQIAFDQFLYKGFFDNTYSDGNWILNNGKWENYSDQRRGSLCIQAVIDTQGASVFALGNAKLQEVVQSAPGKDFIVPCALLSLSSVKITSVKVSCQINGQTPFERTIQTDITPMDAPCSLIPIPLNAIAANGYYNLSVNIKEINGQLNPSSSKTLHSVVKILSHNFPRKVVMEEGTGTWCSWCVRGNVGMAMMKEKYPETFIGIAVHNNDPMTVEAYDKYMTANYIDGYPEMIVNRSKLLIGDPFFDAENFYKLEMDKTPLAGIRLTGGFTNSNRNAITLKTVTTFGVTIKNADFKLAYVLIENGITGYNQNNAYAGGYAGEMGGYETKPSIIPNMVFDDVARGIYAESTGIAGSIPATLNEMTPMEHTYTITLPSSIKNKNQLKVAVFLLNDSTGEIENADIIHISAVTGTPAVSSDKISVSLQGAILYIYSANQVESVEIYNISGQKVLSQKSIGNSIPIDHLNTGVYIVNVITAERINTFKVIK